MTVQCCEAVTLPPLPTYPFTPLPLLEQLALHLVVREPNTRRDMRHSSDSLCVTPALVPDMLHVTMLGVF